jgi:hypothetical protein
MQLRVVCHEISSRLIKFLMKTIYVYGFKLFYYKNTFCNKPNDIYNIDIFYL